MKLFILDWLHDKFNMWCSLSYICHSALKSHSDSLITRVADTYFFIFRVKRLGYLLIKKKSIKFAKQRKLITLVFVLDATIAGIQKC